MSIVKRVRDIPMRLLIWYHISLMSADDLLEEMRSKRRG